MTNPTFQCRHSTEIFSEFSPVESLHCSPLQTSTNSWWLSTSNTRQQMCLDLNLPITLYFCNPKTPPSDANLSQTEWCYNYHDPEKSYALDHKQYPTPDEQRRFLKAYVQHRPRFQPSPSSPSTVATPRPSSSISSFMLDSRGPPSQYKEEEAHREEATEAEVKRLMHQARLWRVANSAQWVAWGIVQAKVPGMAEALATPRVRGTSQSEDGISSYDGGISAPRESNTNSMSPNTKPSAQDSPDIPREVLQTVSLDEEADTSHEVEEEFDYLAYAQERAMFFWGDVLQLGIVKSDELPTDLLEKVKTVEY